MPSIVVLIGYFLIFLFVVYLPYKLYEVHYKRKQVQKRNEILINVDIKGVKIPIETADALQFMNMSSKFKRMFYLGIRNKLKKGKIKPVKMDNGTINYENIK